MLVRLATQTIVWCAIMGALMLGAAGTWRWPAAWVFIALFLAGGFAIGARYHKRDPDLLNERLGAFNQKGQPLWDRIFLPVMVSLWCMWLVGMGLDAMRWHTSHMPVAVQVLGGLMVIAGFTAVLPVFDANSFAAPVVRVQDERGQRVIDTGPYAIARHPMYAVAILHITGMPLLLGSWYGLIGSAIMIFAMAIRAVFEERKLQRELSGYADYMTRVRYRLVPGIW